MMMRAGWPDRACSASRMISSHSLARIWIGATSRCRYSFWFENGGKEELFIGSADLMERNLDRRVEVLTPVVDEDIRKHLKETVLISYLKDTERAMVLDSTGRYVRPEPTGSDVFDSQQHLLKHYADNSTE